MPETIVKQGKSIAQNYKRQVEGQGNKVRIVSPRRIVYIIRKVI